ncbi:MAG: D-alanyl-D-alanine carboxypeptidase/D-alanyl-D-alanine-endopeptidase [Gemmatimonadales bacterium]|nr:D-alanyl-D-alanine carboxypeptidase/D-alanyl-D-alanine-endopeptidase [Gemmatimonadales bacterium]NIN10771.1 D-alanyl-D-alanine carboxypeptidase/D-alanyl-D-alanine-endopeptidase [Gemmatimonadales bacterium]NIQ99001.1 D-alanyl-D-alanine carboxypeptidase/D-alanyl-D-alanine-endopeptidase [Gemmatimonadales bacterium]NIS63820.1 D-alanyl-D-alanine carboxypeptidase/D-alanyl-D-alanine-endopeptidase [Gemmatimonadales bacterium]
MRQPKWIYCGAFVLILLMAGAGPLTGQGNLRRRINRLVEAPPFDRATWGILVLDDRGRERYSRNADQLFIPASNTKLVVAAAASALLPPDYRASTSVYGTGLLSEGVLDGDLVVYGRGDPTYSERCYGPDTLVAGACDSMWTRMDALADSLAARGVRHVTGAVVGDGSYFDANLVHPAWETYDINWWYAAPVAGLGFNDNTVNLTWSPGPTVDAPARITFEPDLGLFLFENRTRTVPADGRRTIDFFREPGTMRIWAEGTVPVDREERTEYFALPDPNLYFAAALRAALAARGLSIGGPTRSTTDSLRYREIHRAPALATVHSRPLEDYIFPILNSSQNWFAEMLLKTLGKEVTGEGSWDAGLEVERQFLIDSVGLDSTSFSLSDGSGLSSGNVMTPRALVQLLAYMRSHPNNSGFMRGMPRSGQRGSLRDRLVGTSLEGRVVAKTGSIFRVNTLSGYVERPDGGVLIFSVMVNNHGVPYRRMLSQIDSVVVELGR